MGTGEYFEIVRTLLQTVSSRSKNFISFINFILRIITLRIYEFRKNVRQTSERKIPRSSVKNLIFLNENYF